MNNSVKVYTFPHGMTIRELKKAIASWPEVNENGDDYKVWIEGKRNFLINQAGVIYPLNKNDGDGANIMFAQMPDGVGTVTNDVPTYSDIEYHLTSVDGEYVWIIA